jgi:uncharacterized protein YcsI (UPF0317 family)
LHYLAEHRGPVVDGEDLLVGVSDAGRGRFGSARERSRAIAR